MAGVQSAQPSSLDSGPEGALQQDPVWIAIRDFPLDDAEADFSFSERLARDHLWERARADRVVAEYRRFLYLLTLSEATLTPSVEVDEAWHLHLAYTRSYWDGLCRAIGRPLHHDPTEGGEKEAARFLEAYERTLELYARTFGSWPPVDIWPDAADRFAPGARHLTVRADRFWLVRRLWSPAVGRYLPLVAVAAGGLGTGLVVDASVSGPDSAFFEGAFAGFIGSSLLVNALFGSGPLALVVTLESDGDAAGGDGCGGCGGCGG
jgi:hypothetical protein